MRTAVTFSLVFGFGIASLASANETAAADPFMNLGDEYAAGVRPVLARLCVDCHATAGPEGELNLERFATLGDVREDANAWVKVAEALDNGEMPPKDADQPTAEERKRVREWVRRYLDAEARSAAGDPGPVPLRRLSNAEYGYTVRDLTGVDLDPAREFPADGAAGEGFTNAGGALAMSPALVTKYLDAAKEISRHAVPLPDGFRFSPSVTRRDWTEEILADIRGLYGRYADASGGTSVNLQGIVFATNEGGRLPLERYLSALLEERDRIAADVWVIDAVARERGLSPKYLASLQGLLDERGPSPLFDDLRARWRKARPEDVAAITSEVARWQSVLTRFQNVGHMKQWVVAADPLTLRQDVRFKIPPATGDEVVLRLAVGDAGDGAAGDFVVWEHPRLVVPGRADLPLRDVRAAVQSAAALRMRLFAAADRSLAAAAEADRSGGDFEIAELAQRHEIDEELLTAWFGYLGVGPNAAAELDRFTERIESASGHDFVDGWGSNETPNLVANASGEHVRIPGNMKPHGVAVHPSPTLFAAAGWQSPVDGQVRIEGAVTHAHPECGNGVTWSLEFRRGGLRRRLATGVAAGPTTVTVGPVDAVSVRTGDLISLLIGPRDGNHSCDLTDIELRIKSDGDATREWSLTEDVSSDVLAGNPHPDRFGNVGVWHFYREPVNGSDTRPTIPDGSLVARWQASSSDDERRALATSLGKLLAEGPPADANHPDAMLYRQLASLGGPLLGGVNLGEQNVPDLPTDDASIAWGPDPNLFGRHPNGSSLNADSLCVQAPAVLEVRLPAELAQGAEFAATATLHAETGRDGSVQVRVATDGDGPLTGLRADLPVLVTDDGEAKKRFTAAFDEFRRWFPTALCYTKIVPVDEVVTLTLFHREDEPLSRLMLDDAEKAKLDRLWDELHFVSRDALAQVDAFAQLMEYATQDADPRVFEPFRKPIEEGAAAFRKRLLDAEPRQVEALVEFAGRAYRHPLTENEAGELRNLYRRLRGEELSHDEAFRLTLARVFASPAFLYRLEAAPAGRESGLVSDWELATRLSYFLWSSAPDDRLREAAAAGRLQDPETAVAEARRMMTDDRIRRLATEFACQWLQVYEFDELDEKSERHFPEFASIRGEMYEESIRFFTDLFRRDGSVLEVFDADYAIVNGPLAAHYGIPGVEGPEWRRIDGVRKYGRGGILGLGATLAKNSGASRTSPILRGTWVSEVLLGEKLPKPPKDVPPLPDEGAGTEGLTVRQLVERHTSDARCATCHVRIDPFGFALERFDAIGRFRETDLGSLPIDTQAVLRDGTSFDGIDGLRKHLLTTRREAVLNQFCKKLLGYALGRGVRLSDEPLLKEMRRGLEENDHRISAAVEVIVRSSQFREIRGQDAEVAQANAD